VGDKRKHGGNVKQFKKQCRKNKEIGKIFKKISKKDLHGFQWKWGGLKKYFLYERGEKENAVIIMYH